MHNSDTADNGFVISTQALKQYCKSRNFNGHFNLTNENNSKYVKVIRFAHAHLHTIIVRDDFDRGFEALPGPAGRVLPRLLCC